jgi:molybdopterin/thiamine biosynthesis adenylyltransferase
MNADRFDRNVRLFGQAGQDRLRAAHVAIVGIGGLGTKAVQDLALLGVGKMTLIDGEELEVTNRNRYVGADHDDPIPGSRKVDLGKRLVSRLDPSILVDTVFDSFVSEAGFDAIRRAQFVLGCLDREGFRLILNEICAAYDRAYFDLASEIIPGERTVFGGRVCCSWNSGGCMSCLGVLDVAEAQRDLSGAQGKRDRDAIYGVTVDALGQAGPSIASINGVIASLAVTEFMCLVTGLREPKRLQTYYGQRGVVTVTADKPVVDCYYCVGVRSQGDKADVKRYLRDGLSIQ